MRLEPIREKVEGLDPAKSAGVVAKFRIIATRAAVALEYHRACTSDPRGALLRDARLIQAEVAELMDMLADPYGED